MTSRTDRIISFLPGTFSAFPKPSVVYSFVDPFGTELLLAENSLAAVMSAHWVDFADRNAELIDDLACMARLYGLAPRAAPSRASCGPLSSEESVEEFREHLKRYVRTFLEGTVTVQGVLRVVAEALGLRIADDYADLDAWWTRRDDGLTTVTPRGDDAARALFGSESASASGESARPALIVGDRDLSSGVDLGGATRLRLKVDGAAPFDIDLVAAIGRTAGVTLDDITSAINNGRSARIVSHDGQRLTLSSHNIGPSGRLEVLDTESDAAPRLLGLAPHIYRGVEAEAAQLTSRKDLSGGVDLSHERFLRVSVDGKFLAEVDCAGAVPEETTLDEVIQAINAAFGFNVAGRAGASLRLTSPTTGTKSGIGLQQAAAQDARDRLFGSVEPFASGRDALPATVVGTKNLSRGVDLSERSKLRVRLDGSPAIVVDCAGADPEHTTIDEIVEALNTRLGVGVAAHDSRIARLKSPATGTESSVAFEMLAPEVDATELIFGIRPREERGLFATRARLVGLTDLSSGFDAAALDRVKVALDGGPSVEVNLRRGAANERAVTLEELSAAFNRDLGAAVASNDGLHLILTSTTTGSASRVAIEPLLVTRRRRFVTRAFITDDAAQALFGFVAKNAQGVAATRAVVNGTADLSRGVDLRDASLLRVLVDDFPALDIDCAGTRPRATTLPEVVAAINARLATLNSSLAKVANISADGQKLVLNSQTAGGGSRIAFSPPRAADALGLLLGVEPLTRAGSGATGVRFVGTVDLSGGIDLRHADRIKLRVDDAPAVEISCARQSDPEHTGLSDIVLAINLALNLPASRLVAEGDGTHVVLTSPTLGEGSRIELLKPAGSDATEAIFGVVPPRSYVGAQPTAARIVGARELHAVTDLSVARFLTVSIDGRTPVTIDCAKRAANAAAATLAEIVTAINEVLGAGVAAQEGRCLTLTSPTAGPSSRIELSASTGGDARAKLLGDVPDETKGDDPAPAVIKGTTELLSALDMSERHTLRLSVDGARPVDVEVAGVAPATTAADEVVRLINQKFPGLASLTPEGNMRLTSPARGDESSLSLLPVRALELIEYPPAEATYPPAATADAQSPAAEPPQRELRHGDRWSVTNDGASEADIEIALGAPQGTAGPELVNLTNGYRVKLLSVIRPGERVVLRREAGGKLYAALITAGGETRTLPRESIVAGPLGTHVHVPFKSSRHLSDGAVETAASLQLDNPLSHTLVLLRAREFGAGGNRIAVTVAEATLTGHDDVPAADESQVRLTGRLRHEESGPRLVDANDATLAHLRAGPGVALSAYLNRVVAVEGTLHPSDEAAPLLVVEQVAALFDVKIRAEASKGGPREESYTRVSIGAGEDDPHELATQINYSDSASRLVRAETADRSAALVLPRGRSSWTYFDCFGPRFNREEFDTRFAGGRCVDRAVFNYSRFSIVPPGGHAPDADAEASAILTVFALPPANDPPVRARFRWMAHQPGAFVVNLPLDLPENFGARFNQTRFGIAGEELYEGVVTEPADDPDHLVARINNGEKKVKEKPAPGGSTLLRADIVERVPLGFEVATIPFRKPRRLTDGSDTEAARIFLAEKDVPGFIRLSALKPGAWGNSISVAARKAGPARFDVTVAYAGARFENARLAALGGDQLPVLTDEILRPGPAGALQAKAAGVKTQVTRDRAESQT